MKDSHQRKVVDLRGVLLPLEALTNGFWYGAGFFFLWSVIGGIRGARNQLRGTQAEHQLRHQAKLIMAKDDCIDDLEGEIEAHKQLLKQAEEEKHAVIAQAKVWRQQLEEDFKQRELALQQQFAEEAELRTHVQVSEMQESYERVNHAYQALKARHLQIKGEALNFDLNFDGSRYESLLKGRKFEIFFAKQLLQNPDFEIVEWTSDKGFENDIYVKSNGNPDFVICYRKFHYFAVECKYRGGFFFKDNSKHRVSWVSKWQADRYQAFSQDRDIPVFVALGFLGEAESPENNFFGTLEGWVHHSSIEEVASNGKTTFQLVARLDDVSAFTWSEGRLPQLISECVPAGAEKVAT